mgnify:FL=1
MKSLIILCVLLTACAGMQTSAPEGYARTCKLQPEQPFCKFSKSELESVNRYFNAFPYVEETIDDWTPITEKGDDCDSYATAKYNRLVELGWPKSSLRLATTLQGKSDYHAVLLVDLCGITLVLDNRYPDLWTPEETGYKFHKIQIAGTQKWEWHEH